MIKLPPTELKVMNVIWDSEEKLCSKDIMEKLSDSVSWKRTTILTLLSRLIEKNFLLGEKIGRHTYYKKLIGKKDYADFETMEFMKNIHNNSIDSLISSLKKDKYLSNKDLDKIII